MHTAVIKRIGVNADETLLATGSEDKTVRLWSLPDGRLKRTLRLPIGPGNEGKVYAVALSPDGALVAAGGWDLRRRHQRIMSICSMPPPARSSGGWVRCPTSSSSSSSRPTAHGLPRDWPGATAFGSGTWQAAAEIAGDTNVGGDSYGVAFDRAGRFATTSLDGFLRLYDRNGALLRKAKAPGGSRPYRHRLLPGRQAARRRLRRFDRGRRAGERHAGPRLCGRRPPASTTAIWSHVAWSRDGRHLFAAGHIRGPRRATRCCAGRTAAAARGAPSRGR